MRCAGASRIIASAASARRAASSRSPPRRSTPGRRARARRSEWFSAYLDEWPGDLRVRWLLNIAAMTLGEYPEKVPPRFLIPVGTVPLEARPRAVRERRDPRRPDRAGARPGRRLHLRRLHRRRPARPLHDLVRRRPRGLAVRQPRRRPVRGPLGGRRARRSGLRPERHARRLRQRRPTRRRCSSEAPGRSRPGCRCCETRGTASSRT